MTRYSLYIYVVIFIMCGLFVHAPLFAQEKKLIPFTLKDQFDREYTEKSFPGKILIVIEGDQEGSKYCTKWKKAISDVLEKNLVTDHIQFVGVADLRKVPSSLEEFIKGKFSKKKHKWLLMDWKGMFATAYEFVLESSNILIFNRQQHLVHQISVRELSPDKLEMIVNAVKRITMDNL